MSARNSLALIIITLVMPLTLTFAFTSPVHASSIDSPISQGEEPPDPASGGTGGSSSGGTGLAEVDSAVDETVGFIKDLTMSAIKFGMVLSGLIFTTAVTWAAAKGTLGSALGNHMQVSQGVISVIFAIGSLILVLSAVPIADALLTSLSTKFSDSVDTMEIANVINSTASTSGATAGSGIDPQEVFQMAALQETVVGMVNSGIRLILGIGTIGAIAATFMGAFDTQLGNLFGGGMMASRGMMRIIGALASGTMLAVSFPISSSIVKALVPKLMTSLNFHVLGGF